MECKLFGVCVVGKGAETVKRYCKTSSLGYTTVKFVHNQNIVFIPSTTEITPPLYVPISQINCQVRFSEKSDPTISQRLNWLFTSN